MTSHRKLLVRLALCLVLGLTLSNCGGVSYYDSFDFHQQESDGVYHPVEKGQTLYSIARAYGVSVRELQRVNGVWDPSELEAGHHLWIPNARRVVSVPPTALDTPARPEPSVSKKEKKKKKVRKKRTATGRRKLMWPVKGGILTSHFGTRRGSNHHGIDIGARRGTPVRAAEKGTVKFSGWGPTGYGLMIIIKHPGNLTTVYAHNSRNLVKEGHEVKRGQMIARVGKTGRASGPHLHFEVRNDAHAKNPLLYLRK